MANLVVFEPGYAAFAGMRVPVADAGTQGEIRIGDETGCVIRPLLYGERSRAVLRYAGSGNPVASVSAAILHMALVQPGTTDPLLAEILALVLAGAEQEAPPFSAAALAVARAGGWDIRQIEQTEASAVDRLAIHVGGPLADSADDGWTRIVLLDAPRTDTPADVRRALAERLLARAEAQPVQNAVPDAQANPALESSHAAQPNEPFGFGNVTTPGEPPARPEQAAAQEAPAQYPRLAFDLARLNSTPRRVEQQAGDSAAPANAAEPLPAIAIDNRQAAGGPLAPPPSSPSPHSGLQSSAAAPRRTEYAMTATQTPAPARFTLRSRPAGMAAGVRDVATPAAVSNALAVWSPNTAQPALQPVPVREQYTPGEARLPSTSDAVQAAAEPSDPAELADTLAALLDLEADLRGIAR